MQNKKRFLSIFLSCAVVLTCLFGGITSEKSAVMETAEAVVTMIVPVEEVTTSTTAVTAVTTAPPVSVQTVTTATSISIVPVTSLATVTWKEHPIFSISEPDYSECFTGNTFRIEYLSACPPVYLHSDVAWSSSDENIAVIDENGYVTIKGAGTVTISGNTGRISDSVTFTAWEKPAETTPLTTVTTPVTTTTSTSISIIPVTSVEIITSWTWQEHPIFSISEPDYSECFTGNTFRIEYLSACPPVYLQSDVAWSSSDENIAVIDENGYVTIKGAGTVTISGNTGRKSDSVTFNTWDTSDIAGDVNNDGSIDVFDMIMLRREMVKDNTYTVNDIVRFRKYLLNK